MLGIRLSGEAEERLARHAREVGRAKSVIVRDWIMERLEREDVDELIRNAARLHAAHFDAAAAEAADAASAEYIRHLDAEDGGYDWGPEGPPPFR